MATKNNLNNNESPLGNGGKITITGNLPVPGQTKPSTIIITRPKRFNIDISTAMHAIRAFDGVDYTQRTRLYDLYTDCLIDGHLLSVLNKRKNAVRKTPIEFVRDGKPDDSMSELLDSPWFFNFLGDVMDAQFWGNTLVQFYKDGDWLNYDLIPRKNYDPVRKLILRYQFDLIGTPFDNYPDLLFIGDARDLGLLGPASFYVIYKRNTVGDWAEFSEIFGMPVREYTYDADDADTRNRIMEDVMSQGSNSVYIHPKESALTFVDSNNKDGSNTVYKGLSDFCNAELSKMLLGNTLTTQESARGTQALGKVHEEIEEGFALADKRFVLNVLNYEMTEIFMRFGINVKGGKFRFKEEEVTDLSKQVLIVETLMNEGLPIDDDYLYDTFNIAKPDDYDNMKADIETKKQAALDAAKAAKQAQPKEPVPNNSDDSNGGDDGGGDNYSDPPSNKMQKSFFARLHDFFFKAPRDGAQDW
jgi:phage gp29-like protein